MERITRERRKVEREVGGLERRVRIRLVRVKGSGGGWVVLWVCGSCGSTIFGGCLWAVYRWGRLA